MSGARAADLAPATARVLEVLAGRLATDPHAPTAVTEPARVAAVHIQDSLLGLDVEAVARASRIADIGSGAGLPGLVIAAALPGARVDLVESAGRKSEWIAAAAAAMELENARAITARAEEWAAAEGRDAYDVVLVRALDSLPVLVEYAAPLLGLGGTLVAWKRNLDEAERRAGASAAAVLGMEPRSRGPGKAPAGTTELVLYEKRAPTPPGYPRRPGRARKRPLA